MTISRLAIVHYPDPVLRKKAARVERVTPELLHFVTEMADAMHEANGVGLAAPQLGISLRIIVIDVDDELTAIFNPQITAAGACQACMGKSPARCASA